MDKKKGKVDLTSFFKTPERAEKEDREKTHLADENLEENEAKVINYIRSRGKVRKDDLYEWSKKQGLKPVHLYKILTNLVSKGTISRKFDPEMEDIVYEILDRNSHSLGG